MQRVAGIGGLFFRARDPEAVQRWYTDVLGVPGPPPSYDDPSWWQEAGPTVLAPFAADSADSEVHFERPEQQWSINFRVADLDAMVAQVRAAGTEVTVDPQTYPNGRFARCNDPEGNPVHLWEPAGRDLRP